jgi:hypothetical protein
MSVPAHDFETDPHAWRPASRTEPVSLPPVVELPDADEVRRVVITLVDGEPIEIARVEGREQAVRIARETIQEIEQAQDAGEWPELGGRFVRPDAIVSIDVQALAD